jgi:NTP pyrophosphatase (non-canonical NTP hydrolase)
MAKANQAQSQLTLAEYDERAQAANQFRTSKDAADQLRFGLFGEVGGVLAAVKKSHRDLGIAEQAQVTEELGDALWYLTTVTAQCGLALEAVGHSALASLRKRLQIEYEAREAHEGRLTFHEFDGLMAFCHRQLGSLEIAAQLRQLAAHSGQFLAMDVRPDLAAGSSLAHLGELFADLATVAALLKLSMTQVAEENLKKFESRWPRAGAAYHPRFDDGRPAIERFPRQFSIHFIERLTADGKPYVIQQLNGVNIGDRLTDNKTEPDGYRFHDVFHLAYIAHLGWSPVIRGLLKLKRKSDEDLDENQDGARAMIIEEGIATWIFNHAHHRSYYETTPPGKLEYGLLKQVSDMVKGYEVAQCPLWQWERAILDGFAVFRQLRDAGGGIVHVDMEAHTIRFEKVDAVPEADSRPMPKREVAAAAVLPQWSEAKR